MNKSLFSAAFAALRYMLIAMFGVGFVVAQPTVTTTDKPDPKKGDEVQKLEKFEVTRSCCLT